MTAAENPAEMKMRIRKHHWEKREERREAARPEVPPPCSPNAEMVIRWMDTTHMSIAMGGHSQDPPRLNLNERNPCMLEHLFTNKHETAPKEVPTTEH